MLGVVIANSLLLLFVCWELVGLASYLLIGFWIERPSAAAAAKKAFITTRIGDLALFLGMLWLYHGSGTLLFYDGGRGCLENSSLAMLGATATSIALLIFCGAIGKSGQFPLHTWLPDAMAGPTPVSALIHAATMVAAGVFLVARIYPVFQASGTAMNEIAILASITMLIAALLALVQDDIKRVLAYSTVSQLAYMMAALSVGGYSAGIFHLFTHAFFKALLFLAAGAIIHAVHTNNMSEMGGLARVMPVTFVTFLVGALALAGVAPLAGFWSKDEILTDAWNQGFGGAGHAATSQGVAQIVFVTGMVTAFLTATYVARMLWLAFGVAFRGQGHPHEADAAMLFPLVVLAVGAALAGFVGLGDNSISTWIQTPQLPSEGPATLNLGLILVATVIALAGLAL